MKSSMFFIAERRILIKAATALCVALVMMIASSTVFVKSAKAGEAIYSAILVDLAPIKATGLGGFADPIGVAVKRALLNVYGGNINPKDKSLPVLVVEVETIYYGQEEEPFGARRHVFSFAQTRDEMSGTAIVRKGKTELKRESILANNITQGGWPPIDDVKSGRLQALANQFARAVRYDLDD